MQPDHQAPSDIELTNRAMRGDSASFGLLYDRYVDAIYRYVVFRVTDTNLAEDLTATTFVKTWEVLSKQRKQVNNFRAWLFRTAHNLIIDFYRTRKPEAPLEAISQQVDMSSTPETQFMFTEDSQRLAAATRELPSNLQQVIACRFISRLSHAQTAEIMGLNVGHVRVLQHRALKELQRILGEDFKI